MENQQTEAHAKFTDYALSPDVLEALEELGFVETTPIQEKVIGPILAGRDVVGKAETGTGKTIGFGAPLIGRVDTQRVAVQALVLTPTRELAQQVAGVLEQMGLRRGLGVALLVGGVHASGQIEKLRSGCQVVVGTPGRVLDLLGDRILSLGWCETVVLDEADRMLDMGFIEDVSKILDKTPSDRQTLVFSATIPPQIEVLLRRYMKDPEIHSTSVGLTTVPEISQVYRRVEFRDKFRELRRILDESADETAIIFCNTRRQAIDLDRMLWGHSYSAGALHGEQDQETRFRILEAFRQGDVRILVATDVASRGLDIEDVARVINYEVPDEPEAYVHRIGRTGRASRLGQAITLVSSRERRSWDQILRGTGLDIRLETSGRRGHPRGEERGAAPEREGGSREGGSQGARGSLGGGRRGDRKRRKPRRGPGVEPADRTADAPPTDSAGTKAAEGASGAGAEGAGGASQPRRDPGEPRSNLSRRRRRGRGPSGSRESGAAQPSAGARPGRARSGGDPGGARDGPSSSAGAQPGKGRSAGDPGEARDGPSSSGGASRPPDIIRDPLERKPRPRPEKLKLSAIPDDFIRTEYFDVDPSLVRARKPEAEPTRSKGQRPSSSPPRSSPPARSRDDAKSGSRRRTGAGEKPKGEGQTGPSDPAGKKPGSSSRRRRRRPPRRRSSSGE
ncbi:MAG: DEAD/DEAH box helicase [Planctomycetes bacterium]|nr:DEAD/DEAH box helicase [Planctomycetota bacterium]